MRPPVHEDIVRSEVGVRQGRSSERPGGALVRAGRPPPLGLLFTSAGTGGDLSVLGDDLRVLPWDAVTEGPAPLGLRYVVGQASALLHQFGRLAVCREHHHERGDAFASSDRSLIRWRRLKKAGSWARHELIG
ncbi:hypothetical protein [Streptomyces fuscichromogenes]|uniref:hypothetical protein n=1 Tax=Streptomyces fuscichromogenes TaxID=1324013 RepID=UPI0016703F5C|nr:hypothetical protein [Streptomyces fuscichromogenes]